MNRKNMSREVFLHFPLEYAKIKANMPRSMQLFTQLVKLGKLSFLPEHV